MFAHLHHLHLLTCTTSQAHELSEVRSQHSDALSRLRQQSEALLFALNQPGGAGGGAALEQVTAACVDLKQWWLVWIVRASHSANYDVQC
jgi:hypothetical protein